MTKRSGIRRDRCPCSRAGLWQRIFPASSVTRYKRKHKKREEELIVSIWVSSCGTKGNCPTRIYQMEGEKYKPILSHPAALHFTKMRRKTNGYHDLRMYFHSHAAYGGYVEFYRFDGKRYKRKSCFDHFPDETMEKTGCRDFNKQ